MNAFLRLFAVLSVAVLAVFGSVVSTYAAELAPTTAAQTFAQSQPNPGGGVGAKIEAFADQIKSIARPAGVLSFVIIGLSFAFAPAFKAWAEDNKRQFGLIAAGILLITVAGDLVAMFAPATP